MQGSKLREVNFSSELLVAREISHLKSLTFFEERESKLTAGVDSSRKNSGLREAVSKSF